MGNLTLSLSRRPGVPYYLQLYRHIAEEIRSGGLASGEKLPSKRALAQHLSVSINTVDTAYQMLATEGYLQAVPKSGFYVCPLPQLQTPPPLPEPEPASPPPEPACRFDCSTGSVDTSVFPFATWARLTKDIMYHEPQLLHHGDAQGDLCLRQALCRYLHQFRGVRCLPEQVLLGAGMEYLLMVLCSLLPEQTLYAVEEPGYRKAWQAMENCGRAVVHLPVDQGGLSIRALEESGAQCAYVTPSHQYPTGAVMPAGRRAELLHWAAAQEGRFLVEDDYDSEFRYSGRPIPALQGADYGGRVIYAGTFSRSIAPSIRIAYLVLPPSLLPVYRQRFSQQSSTVSRFEQHTLWRFIQEGHWERHLNRTRNLYKKRRDRLMQSLRNTPVGPRLQVTGAEAGLHLLLRLENGLAEGGMVARARLQGVALVGLSSCYYDPSLAPPATVLCGYARYTEAELEQVAQALGRAWRLEGPVRPS